MFSFLNAITNNIPYHYSRLFLGFSPSLTHEALQAALFSTCGSSHCGSSASAINSNTTSCNPTFASTTCAAAKIPNADLQRWIVLEEDDGEADGMGVGEEEEEEEEGDSNEQDDEREPKGNEDTSTSTTPRLKRHLHLSWLIRAFKAVVVDDNQCNKDHLPPIYADKSTFGPSVTQHSSSSHLTPSPPLICSTPNFWSGIPNASSKTFAVLIAASLCIGTVSSLDHGGVWAWICLSGSLGTAIVALSASIRRLERPL